MSTESHEFDRCVKIEVEAQRKMTVARFQNSISIYRPSRWNLSKFVVIKHFGSESLHEEPSCCLDFIVYRINCVFW